MGSKTGDAIRAARSGAKMTQAALAQEVGLSPGDISKAERGELELSQKALRAIAKATGVTQASLVNGTVTPKAPGTLKLTAAETKLVQLYRKATPEQKSDIQRILNGEKTEVEQLVDSLLGDKWRKKRRR
mgnify:CR=1 FL=1